MTPQGPPTNWPTDWPTEPPAQPPLAPPPLAASTPGTGWPGLDDTDQRSRPKRGIRAGVAIVAVIVVIAVIGAFVAGRRVGEQAAAPSSTTPSTSTPSTTTEPSTPSTTPPSTQPRIGGSSTAPADPDAVRAEVAALSKFVEAQRGLQFREPVTVDVLAPEEFRTRVLQEFDKELESLRAQGDLLIALGMVPADLDVVEAQRKLLGDGVLGFYDPATKALVVRAAGITPFFRQIVVHELTHALDDQHFNLDRPELSEHGDDGDWAFLALVEGNARRIENDYVAQLSPSEQQQLQEEMWELGMEQMTTMLSVPLVLAQLLTAPYDLGDPFVRHLVERGGQRELDEAFSAPPASSEQILHPDKFERREGPQLVERPPAPAPVKAEGVLGEVMTGYFLQGDQLGGLGDLFGNGDLEEMMRELFGDLDIGDVLGGTVDPNEILRRLQEQLGGSGLGTFGRPEVKGWGGDRYVVWDDTDGSGVCVRVDWAMDSSDALAELQRRVGERVIGDPSARVEQPSSDRLRLTRCT